MHLQEHGQSKRIKRFFVINGVKPTHCLDINNTIELLELPFDDLDFGLGHAP
jgi:hypothetical protein